MFLDREHKLMGEASAAAPELLGHTCGAGTAFVQVDLRAGRRASAPRGGRVPGIAVAGRADRDRRRNPEPAGARAFRFASSGDPFCAPGGRRPRAPHHRVDRAHCRATHHAAHHRGARRSNEDTFAKRLAGETGSRPALVLDSPRRSRRTGNRRCRAARGGGANHRAGMPKAEPLPVSAMLGLHARTRRGGE